MMPKLWMVMAVGVILTILGDIFLKRSNGLDRPADLAFGVFLYALGCIPVVYVFRLTAFSTVFLVWEALTIVLAIGIGRALFHESITPLRLIAICLALGALFLSSK